LKHLVGKGFSQPSTERSRVLPGSLTKLQILFSRDFVSSIRYPQVWEGFPQGFPQKRTSVKVFTEVCGFAKKKFPQCGFEPSKWGSPAPVPRKPDSFVSPRSLRQTYRFFSTLTGLGGVGRMMRPEDVAPVNPVVELPSNSGGGNPLLDSWRCCFWVFAYVLWC